jgi:hypothetical protein
MKTTLLALLLATSTSAAYAGGLAEPVMTEAIIVADTASSGGDEWVGITMTLLVFGAAIAGR